MTVEKWNVVMQAIGEMPLKGVIEVYMDIRRQADAALAEVSPATETAE